MVHVKLSRGRAGETDNVREQSLVSEASDAKVHAVLSLR